MTGWAGVLDQTLADDAPHEPAALAAALDLPDRAVEAFALGPFDVRIPLVNQRTLGAKVLILALARLLEHADSDTLPPAERRALVVGTRTAALGETIHFLQQVDEIGPTLVNPGLFPFTVMNAPAGMAAIRHACQGANVTLNNGATSLPDALASAADMVAAGREEIAFAGAFEALGPAAGASVGRDRPALAASVLFALETAAGAAARGVRPLAELRAYTRGELAATDGAREEVVNAAAEASSAPAAALEVRSTPGAAGERTREERVLFDAAEALLAASDGRPAAFTAGFEHGAAGSGAAVVLAPPADSEA